MCFLLLLSFLSTVTGDSLEITFIGNAGFELYDGETTILIDLPYKSGSYGYMEYDYQSIKARGNVISAITHRHSDHFEAKLLLDNDWLLFAPYEVTRSFEADRVIATNPSIFGNFRLTKYRTPHRNTEHYSILIQWKGVRMYFVGDTDDPTQVLKMHDLDLLFITSWLSCAASYTGKKIDAKKKVLYHHYSERSDRTCTPLEVYEQGESFWVEDDSKQ